MTVFKIEAKLVRRRICDYDMLEDEDDNGLFSSQHIKTVKKQLGIKEGDKVKVCVEKVKP